MPAKADGRRRLLLDLLRDGPLPVRELATALGVSSVTVRRDVEALSSAGRLSRVHGRVARTDPRDDSGPVIGMLVPAIDRHHGELIRGAREATARAGARLVLGVCGDAPGVAESQLGLLVDAGATGVLLAPRWPEQGARPADGTPVLGPGMPAVLVERRGEPGTALAGLDSVRTDHAHGIGLALRHLAARGRRRIGLLTDLGSPVSAALLAGHRELVGALGLAGRRCASVEELATAAVAGRLDAAVVHPDEDALRLLQAAQARGLDVPRDLALVAYGDDVAALADVPLTAVSLPRASVGEAAATLLLRRLGAGDGASEALDGPYRHLDLLPRLCVRVSCGDHLDGAAARPA